jgi:hypothetical protein
LRVEDGRLHADEFDAMIGIKTREALWESAVLGFAQQLSVKEEGEAVPNGVELSGMLGADVYRRLALQRGQRAPLAVLLMGEKIQ